MSEYKNPYLTDAEVLPGRSDALKSLDPRQTYGEWRGQVASTGPFFAYILAHQRKGEYYFDVAASLPEIEGKVKQILRDRRMARGEDIKGAALPVWLESCESQDQARERIAQIKRLPSSWQRHLIWRDNMEWFDLVSIAIGWPDQFWWTIPESL